MHELRHDRQYRRVGDTAKCPACGWRMDSDAYRCPKCYIYFCFKCRARVTEREPQFQCANQSCQCYGKLLCAACTVVIPEFEDVPVKDDIDNGGLKIIAIVIVVAVAAAFTLWLFAVGEPIWAALCLSAAVISFVSSVLVIAWFRPHNEGVAESAAVPERVKIADHRCCIQCKQPVKNLQ